MSDEVCLVGNLGPRGRRQRFLTAVVMGFVVAAATWFLASSGAPWPAWLLLFLPLFVGALGLFQATAST